MASSLRRVRRLLRQRLLALVQKGEGNLKILEREAARILGQDVGYEVVLRAFVCSEVANAMAQLRSQGEVQSVGKDWKDADSLSEEEVDIVQTRLLKRTNGSLKSSVKLSHAYGRTEDAVFASELLRQLSERLGADNKVEETVNETVE